MLSCILVCLPICIICLFLAYELKYCRVSHVLILIPFVFRSWSSVQVSDSICSPDHLISSNKIFFLSFSQPSAADCAHKLQNHRHGNVYVFFLVFGVRSSGFQAGIHPECEASPSQDIMHAYGGNFASLVHLLAFFGRLQDTEEGRTGSTSKTTHRHTHTAKQGLVAKNIASFPFMSDT